MEEKLLVAYIMACTVQICQWIQLDVEVMCTDTGHLAAQVVLSFLGIFLKNDKEKLEFVNRKCT